MENLAYHWAASHLGPMAAWLYKSLTIMETALKKILEEIRP